MQRIVEGLAFWPPFPKGKITAPQYITTEEGHSIAFVFIPNPHGTFGLLAVTIDPSNIA